MRAEISCSRQTDTTKKFMHRFMLIYEVEKHSYDVPINIPLFLTK